MKDFDHGLAAALLLVALAVGPVWADDPASPAQRVRLTVPTLHENAIVGRLVAADDLALRIEKAGREGKAETITVPRAALTRLEVSRSRSRKGKGALIGALIGIGASVAVGLAAGDDCSSLPLGDDLGSRLERNLCFDSGDMGLMTAILAVPAGTVVGALVAPGEKWETADATTMRVGILSSRGFGVRLALSF
jgi:hypothetical protein